MLQLFEILKSERGSVWKVLLWSVVLVVAAVAGGAGYVYTQIQPVDLQAGEQVLFAVTPGMTTRDIGGQLYDKGLIKNVLVFRGLARIEGLESSLQAGQYAIKRSQSMMQIIGALAKGEVASREFTIPEGYTLDQIAALIEKNKFGSAEKFRKAAANSAPYAYMEPNPDVKYKSEGFLFPDTYKVPLGINEENLVKMMLSEFDREFTPEMRKKAAARGMSIREVIVLASLVEKEARVQKERPVIARVFMNRLKEGMALQSCATIQYILGEAKPELTIQDTEIPSPYNTYMNMGLPPGPIANPGMAAIKAVLDPADTDYLFFVAYKNGEHLFGKTYEEHLANIATASAGESVSE